MQRIEELVCALSASILVLGMVKLRGDRVNSVSIGFNLALGWFPILAAKPLLMNMPTGCVALLVGSAACYISNDHFFGPCE